MVNKRGVQMIPLVADEGVDPGTLYMLPPDVVQAFNDEG